MIGPYMFRQTDRNPPGRHTDKRCLLRRWAPKHHFSAVLNAVARLTATRPQAKQFVEALWDQPIPAGQNRFTTACFTCLPCCTAAASFGFGHPNRPVHMNFNTARPILLTLMSFTLSAGIARAGDQDSPLGQFDGHADIGAPKLAGSAKYDPASQEYTVTAGGTNMWFGRDQCHFLWKRMKGDFILRARAEFIGKGADAHRKLGWMVRPSLDADPLECLQVRGDSLLREIAAQRKPIDPGAGPIGAAGRNPGPNLPRHQPCLHTRR
jgi:hypothetical protein